MAEAGCTSVEELRQCCEAAIKGKDALELHSVVQRITSCSDHVRSRSRARRRARITHACSVYTRL